MTEKQLSIMVSQRLRLCLPLMERTGIAGTLRVGALVRQEQTTAEGAEIEDIDPIAGEAIGGMGGNEFL